MKNKKFVIEGEYGDWLCPCGNNTGGSGFFTCDKDGFYQEPLRESDWECLYVCYDCGRIIDSNTKQIVGRNLNTLADGSPDVREY